MVAQLYFLCCAKPIFFYPAQQRDHLSWRGQKILELLSAKPDKQTVLLFIDEIHAAIRAYYKNKYTHFDSSIPYDVKISTLNWPKEMKAITGEEHEELSTGQKQKALSALKVMKILDR